MTSLNQEMFQVENFFSNKGIRLSADNLWFKACVDCFRTQCSNYKLKDLIDFVYEQWLLADLKDIRSNTLPVECKNLEKFTLIGKHAVQLNYILDISNSAYSQMQKIKRPDSVDNLEVNAEKVSDEKIFFQTKNHKRALKFEITDGSLTVIGFEDKPIQCLKSTIPGEKAIIVGPIDCYKGILMLSEKNIEILGGEVDTLLVPNAVSNILAKMLNMPEDPDPYKKQSDISSNDVSSTPADCFDDDSNLMAELAENIDIKQLSETLQTSETSVQNIKCEFEDDDFDLLAAQTASLAEFEAAQKLNQVNLPGNSTTSIVNSSEVVEYININDPKRLKKELEASYGRNSSYQKVNATISTNKTIQKINTKESLSSSTTNTTDNKSVNSVLRQPTINELPGYSNSSYSKTTINPSTQEIYTNFLDTLKTSPIETEEFIDEVEEIFNDEDNTEEIQEPYPPRKFPAIRVVHGQIIRLHEKLSLKNNEWVLSVIVLAKGLELEMIFASEVLDKIIGITAKELTNRRNDLKSDPNAKEKMNKLLREGQMKLKNLNCEMVIRFPHAIAKPIIIDVLQ